MIRIYSIILSPAEPQPGLNNVAATRGPKSPGQIDDYKGRGLNNSQWVFHQSIHGLGGVTDFKLFTMEVEYVVPRIIEAQKPKQEPHGTNPDRQQRCVYLRRSPLKKSWAGRKGRFLAKLARFPPVAHWLIRARSTISEPGLTWEIKPVKKTGWRLEYGIGR